MIETGPLLSKQDSEYLSKLFFEVLKDDDGNVSKKSLKKLSETSAKLFGNFGKKEDSIESRVNFLSQYFNQQDEDPIDYQKFHKQFVGILGHKSSTPTKNYFKKRESILTEKKNILSNKFSNGEICDMKIKRESVKNFYQSNDYRETRCIPLSEMNILNNRKKARAMKIKKYGQEESLNISNISNIPSLTVASSLSCLFEEPSSDNGILKNSIRGFKGIGGNSKESQFSTMKNGKKHHGLSMQSVDTVKNASPHCLPVDDDKENIPCSKEKNELSVQNEFGGSFDKNRMREPLRVRRGYPMVCENFVEKENVLEDVRRKLSIDTQGSTLVSSISKVDAGKFSFSRPSTSDLADQPLYTESGYVLKDYIKQKKRVSVEVNVKSGSSSQKIIKEEIREQEILSFEKVQKPKKPPSYLGVSSSPRFKYYTMINKKGRMSSRDSVFDLKEDSVTPRNSETEGMESELESSFIQLSAEKGNHPASNTKKNKKREKGSDRSIGKFNYFKFTR